jgi:hypothetical protein
MSFTLSQILIVLVVVVAALGGMVVLKKLEERAEKARVKLKAERQHRKLAPEDVKVVATRPRPRGFGRR